MGLNKTIPTERDVDATFWKVGVHHVDHRTKEAWVQLDGWKSKASSNKPGAQPLDTKTIQVDYEAVKSGRNAFENWLIGQAADPANPVAAWSGATTEE